MYALLRLARRKRELIANDTAPLVQTAPGRHCSSGRSTGKVDRGDDVRCSESGPDFGAARPMAAFLAREYRALAHMSICVPTWTLIGATDADVLQGRGP
jgi:hypothetical protein